MKTLTLKSRSNGQWHDVSLLRTAIGNIAKGKQGGQAQMWGIFAAKITVALEAEDSDIIGDIQIDFSNKEAKVLWKYLMKLPTEKWARHLTTGEDITPSPGLWRIMLVDWAEELGFNLPQVDLDDLLDDDDENLFSKETN